MEYQPSKAGRLRRVWARSWQGLVITGFICALGGAVAGFVLTRFSAQVLLIRDRSPVFTTSTAALDLASLQQPSAETLVELARSPEVLQNVTLASTWLMSPDHLAAVSGIQPIRGTDFIRLTVRGHGSEATVKAANDYADATLVSVQKMQSNQVARLHAAIEQKVSAAERDLQVAAEALDKLRLQEGNADFAEDDAVIQQATALARREAELRLQSHTLDLQITNLQREIPSHHPELLAARQSLERALLRYTDEHPRVQELRTNIVAIQERLNQQSGEIAPELALTDRSLAKDLYTRLVDLRSQRATIQRQLEDLASTRELQGKNQDLPRRRAEFVRLKAEYNGLRYAQDMLVGQLQSARALRQNLACGFRVQERAGVGHLTLLPKIGGAAKGFGLGGLAGFLLGTLVLLSREKRKVRIRTAEDLQEATRLPVLASLGNLRSMSPAERDLWAFNTLTTLRGKLNARTDEALVCGFISSQHGEGKSTWMNLLAEAASKRGYRVLTIAASRQNGTDGLTAASHSNLPARYSVVAPTEITHSLTLADNAPRQLEIPLPGWAWDLERRTQWQEAVARLNAMQNVVVLMELPPAGEPESMLLAENIAQIIWLCGKDLATIKETRAQIDMLKYSRSKLAGAVFNDSGGTRRHGRKVAYTAAALLGAAFLVGQALAQAPPTPAVTPAFTNSLSVVSPTALADWQRRLTLGPGDVLSLSIFEQPDSARAGVTIGPDGRINYLQARDFTAAGLTVDELRDRLEQTLLKFYRPPLRLVVVPTAYNSKKFYLLGNVVRPGVIPMQRPLTIIEAIATAGGFVSTVNRRSTLMGADLTRSFLVRQVESNAFYRLPVDFESLFLKGDLNQNIPLAPNDYLYFPPLDVQEIYVLGDGVIRAGVVPYSADMTVLRAIAARGGYAEKAYRKRVLVIRGSLNAPQRYVVDTGDILNARAPDFKLEPRDIVYVVKRPWAFAEQLLQDATTDFLNSVVITWTGLSLGPFIRSEIFPPLEPPLQ